MSKYEKLWQFVKAQDEALLLMSFDEIKEILGYDIDHSFLNFKKELLQYGFAVDKISIKNKTVKFIKTN